VNGKNFFMTSSFVILGVREMYRIYRRHFLCHLSYQCAEKGMKRASLFLLKRIMLSPEPVFSFLSISDMYIRFLKATEKHAYRSFTKNAEKGIGLFEKDGLYIFPFTLCRQYKKAVAAAEEMETLRRERVRMEKKKHLSLSECRRSCESLFPISIPPLD
jgi:hypothetical protein